MVKSNIIRKIKDIFYSIKYYPYRDEQSYYLFHTPIDDVPKLFVLMIFILFIDGIIHCAVAFLN